MVKEPEPETGGRLLVLLDARPGLDEDTFEQLVRATASLTRWALEAEQQPLLVCEQRGDVRRVECRSLAQALELLAEVRPVGTLPPEAVAARHPRPATVLLAAGAHALGPTAAGLRRRLAAAVVAGGQRPPSLEAPVFHVTGASDLLEAMARPR